MSYIDELKKECIISDLSAVELACAEVDSLRRQLTEARKDSERLDAIPHGWRISREVGASGYLDRWYVWTTDWSQPLGEGDTLRAAIDAARNSGGAGK